MPKPDAPRHCPFEDKYNLQPSELSQCQPPTSHLSPPLHFPEFLAKESKARKHEHLHCTHLTLVPMKDHRLCLPAGVTLAPSGLHLSPGSGPPAALSSLLMPPPLGEGGKSNCQGHPNPASSHNDPLHPLLRQVTAV